MVDWVGQAKGLAFPLAYLTLLIGLMATFSSLYRKRQASRASTLEPWFPQHLQRDVYLSLWHMDGDNEKKTPAVPESVLKAALLRRAAEDIQRVLSLRSAKQALSTLLQRGSVGDDLWQRFQRAEKEMEAELQDVVNEANALSAGWGQQIFQSANEINANARLREHVGDLDARHSEERRWWDAKRGDAQRELLEELDRDEAKAASRKASVATSSDGEPVLVDAGGATGGQDSAKKKKKSKSKK